MIIRDDLDNWFQYHAPTTDNQVACRRYSLQSEMLHDGKPTEWQTFDEMQLELVEAKMHVGQQKTGGPQPNDPKRPKAM